MSITSGDLLFVESERMVDDNTATVGIGGGGRMGRHVVVDATENNAFPDVMPGDRISGTEQFRRIFMAAWSADEDTLFNSQCGLRARPSDANVELLVFSGRPSDGSADVYTTGYPSDGMNTAFLRWQAKIRAAVVPADITPPICLGSATTGSHVITTISGAPDPDSVKVGDLVLINYIPSGFLMSWRQVTAISGDQSAGTGTITVDGDGAPLTLSGVEIRGYVRRNTINSTPHTQPSAVALSTSGVSATATAIPVDKLTYRFALVPAAETGTLGMDGAAHWPLFFPGDRVLIFHASTSVHEFAVLERVDYDAEELVFTAGLANAYSTGAKIVRPIDLGNVQAAITGLPFMQQTWLRTFAAVPSGTPTTGRYSGDIGLVNDGATTDRWAMVFKSSTQFDAVSERLGVVAAGNIATDFSPLNPETGQPFFTLYAAAWGAGGIITGNAFRFDTAAAAAPLWLLRIVLPSSPAGTVVGTLFARGDVDA